MQASDMVGLMYPLTPLTDVLLTKDRKNAASAIRSFTGRKYDYTARNLIEERYVNYVSTMEAERIRNQVTLSALKGLIIHMGGLKEGRKSLILVTECGPTAAGAGRIKLPSSRTRGCAPPIRWWKAIEGTVADFFMQAEMMSDLKLVTDMANRA
jgi:hypothetical protein